MHKILHINDRLSTRGGADWHLLGILGHGHPDFAFEMAAEVSREALELPCPYHKVKGLSARTRRPCRLSPLLETAQPDLIHVHNVMNPAALEIAAKAGAIMTVQDHRTFCPGRGKWTLDERVCTDTMSPEVCGACFDDSGYFERIWALTNARLDAIRAMRAWVVLSEYMKTQLTQVGLDPERIWVIPPFPFDLDEHPAAAQEEAQGCVLFVGRLVEAKGVEDAIEAWRRADVGLPLVIAGEGPERERLEGDPNISWVGWADHEALAEIYARSRALLMCSRWQEPYGIVGLEAQAFKVPVVAWESGGVAEWGPEVCVEWGDIDGLAAGLREVVRAAAPPVARPAQQVGDLMDSLASVYRQVLAG